MGITTQRLDFLLTAYSAGTLSQAEYHELITAIADPAYGSDIKSYLDKRLERGPYLTSVTGNDTDWDSLFEHIRDAGNKRRSTPILRAAWFRYSAAAILVLAIGIYLWPEKELSVPQVHNIVPVPDVEPGSNKAILTLADGSRIVLDNAAEGTLADLGAVRVVKLPNGEIEYKAVESSLHAGESAFNTMSTPRGGQYTLSLPDGSRVWLNAASSITYPVVFTGGERKVSITGEAYFEVAKNPAMPFRVQVKGQPEIEVVGTSFNVNAYPDGQIYKTSLLEGSVRIGHKLLTPGKAYLNGELVATNLDQDIAWKNGVFNFHKLDLTEVMRQLARWYDIEVVYEGEIPDIRYYGEMGRDLNLSQVLKGLEGPAVRFRIEDGKKIIVQS